MLLLESMMYLFTRILFGRLLDGTLRCDEPERDAIIEKRRESIR